MYTQNPKANDIMRKLFLKRRDYDFEGFLWLEAISFSYAPINGGFRISGSRPLPLTWEVATAFGEPFRKRGLR